MKMSLLVAAASMLASVLSPMGGLHAAELKVLAGGSMTGVLNELGPQFERVSGHKLIIHFDTAPNLIKLATSGQPFDLGIVPVDVFKDAAAKAKFGPTVEVARVGYGVAVRAGAPKPDVSTTDAFKKTLLDAKSITFLPASAAGAYISKLFERLGIDQAMKAKTVVQTEPGANRPGGHQWRCRARGICEQPVDRAGRRNRRSISSRIAAGADFPGSRRCRYQGSYCCQGLHRLPHLSCCGLCHQGQGHDPWLGASSPEISWPPPASPPLPSTARPDTAP